MIKRIFGTEFQTVVNDQECKGLTGIVPELAALYAAGIKKVSNKNLIWITGENENTDILKNDLQSWSKFLGDTETMIHLHCLPWEDPYINNSIPPETAGEKSRLLADIKENEKNTNKNIAVITTLAALSIELEKKKDKDLLIRTLSINDPLTPGELVKHLEELGYHNKKRVQDSGDFSFHGKIVELFPAGFDYPYRVKFVFDSNGARIESIKRFHPVSQISIEPVGSIKITTTVYFETTKSKHTEILFLTELLNNYRIIATDFDYLREEYQKLLQNFDNMRLHHGDDTGWRKVSEIFTFPVDSLEVFNLVSSEGTAPSPIKQIKPELRTFLNFSPEYFSQLAEENNTLVFCRENEKQEEAIKKKFGGAEISAEIIDHDIPVSLYFPGEKTYFISFLGRSAFDAPTDSDRFNRHIFDGIEPGDCVVHQKHGIGRFSGFKHVEIDGEKTEYLSITYKDGAKVLVPVHELDVLTKYVGFHGQEPGIDKIGGSTWEAKKKAAKKNMVAYAGELLDLYAKRKAITGHSFKKNTEAEQAFIKHFSFVETKDQKAAIKDVLTDLEAPHPMDRLICGDVSFGKTEIALRAAVRVAGGGKQVAVLCPTTVLAHQHFTTFKHRFSTFPYRVELLSRNVAPARRKELLKDLGDGEIDIMIGTHALLGSAVDFKCPGLFIIDEEQRFGVFQKEKLKKGREHIDVLSLSATPIPRTLSFTVAGLQDVSLVNTPPVGRKAVKNYIGPYSEELMMWAITKEINRNGQVFIIYNNIEGIYPFREKLETLLPGIDFSLIHAKMAAEEIEETVLAFTGKKTGVLVSTTIIENGIDIPNVNTLIIMDAHMFGLTQLYQLRGRIGRGTRQAYTYFFHGKNTDGLSEKAGQRLEAIREFSELGSGYKIAEFDLKMRGAGSLLGNKQHGHIEALGFDYFLGLLKKTVDELRGQETETKDTEFSIRFPYSISEDFITDTQERISIYKRILSAGTAGELVEIREEIEDRYGEPEESLLKGFFAQNTRILGRFFQFQEVDVSLDMLEIVLRPVYDDKKEKLQEFIDLFDARVTESTGLAIEYDDYGEFMETLQIFLLEIEETFSF